MRSLILGCWSSRKSSTRLPCNAALTCAITCRSPSTRPRHSVVASNPHNNDASVEGCTSGSDARVAAYASGGTASAPIARSSVAIAHLREDGFEQRGSKLEGLCKMLTVDAIAATEIGECERDSAHSLISTSTELAGTQRELEVLECRMRERRVLVETHRVELDIGA